MPKKKHNSEGFLINISGIRIKTNFIVFDSGVDANKALASEVLTLPWVIPMQLCLSRKLKVEMVWIREVLGEIEALAVKNNLVLIG